METAGTAVIFQRHYRGGRSPGPRRAALPFLRSVGYGWHADPLVSVLVATTLLPVVLKTLGPRIDWPRRTKPRTNRFLDGLGFLVVRRRWLMAGLAMVILAALAIPLLSLNIGDPKANSLATEGRRTRACPRWNGPA